MFTIDVLPAEFGDSLWIEYGPDRKTPHRILIDCGTKGVYKKALKPRIEALAKGDRHFELFIVSHVDSDHIGGSIDFVTESRPLGITFGDIWFNGYKQLIAASNMLGAPSGEDLTALLEDMKLPWNKAFRNKPVALKAAGVLPVFKLPGGMKITLVAPFVEQLVALIPEWEDACKDAGITPGKGRRPKAARGGPVMLGDPPVDALADSKFASDNAKPNGSSIAVLAEYGGKRALLLADAHVSTVLVSLQKLWKGKPQTVDVFKLAHHGSRANTSVDLVKAVKCKKWIVSTNGKVFKHPDTEAIARIVKYGSRGQTLYFNYETKYNDMWKSGRLTQKFGYTPIYADKARKVDL
jgi:hypothetical protein